MSPPDRARSRRAASRKVVPGGLPSVLVATLVAAVMLIGATREPVRDRAEPRGAALTASAV